MFKGNLNAAGASCGLIAPTHHLQDVMFSEKTRTWLVRLTAAQ